MERQSSRIQKHVASEQFRGRKRDRCVLDESSVQLSKQLVADVDGVHLQNFASVVEPGHSRSKKRPNSRGSGLAVEMDRFPPCRNRRVHDVLSPALPEANGRRTDHADRSETAEAGARTAPGCALNKSYGCELKIRSVVRISDYDHGLVRLRFKQKTGMGAFRGETTEQVGALQRLCRSALGKRRADDDFAERAALYRSTRRGLDCAGRIGGRRRVNSAIALVNHGRPV